MTRESRNEHPVAPQKPSLNDEAIADLVAGVAACPDATLPGLERRGWNELLGSELREELVVDLSERAARTAQEYIGDIEMPAQAERLFSLRGELQDRELDGFIVPIGDENYTEFVPLRAHRLQWLTGFSGSAGTAIVLSNHAALFVDGRYTLQAQDQVPADLFSLHHIVEDPPHRWLSENLNNGGRLGYDPWLHTEDEVERFAKACVAANAELRPVETNPVDAVWPRQPPPPISPTIPHPERFAGEPSSDKRNRLAKAIAKDGIDASVLTAPDSIAWLLNIRGADVACTPLPLAFAILNADASVDLFIDRRKLSNRLGQHWGPDVRVKDRSAFSDGLDRLAVGNKRVNIDPATTASWISQRLRDSSIELIRAPDPCTLPKAIKNETELNGTREAHKRDGAALTRFLAWLAHEAPRGEVDELMAAEQLAMFRAESELIQSLSFNTISGAGPNGAIVHYRATRSTNRLLEPGQLFLLDSGAQYLDGTTDVTRTIAIGVQTDEMRDRFTRVLRGHIAIATCRFPEGTTGSQIDVLARQFLWQTGLDYDHGTGHGVGSYLGVHEGPQRISKLPNKVPLRPGMIVSNEPGYYKTDAYGIRIENLVAVVGCNPLGEERPFNQFETLTLAPIDRNLIDTRLLTIDEICWVNQYHARVCETLGERVDPETRTWLYEVTTPLPTA